MRISKFLILLVALATFVAACGDDDGGGEASDRNEEPSGASEDADAAELDDGVAAVVDGEEISVASVDEEVDAFAANPQFSEQMEGADGESARAQLRAQILSTAIVTKIVSASAEDLGRPVTDEDISETRQELEDEVGGAEALDEALEQQGYTASLLDMELVGLAGLRNVAAALDEQAGDEATADEEAGDQPTDGSGQELSASDRRAQQFLTEELAAADVTVDGDFGTWNAETGQVIPPGAPQPGAGAGG